MASNKRRRTTIVALLILALVAGWLLTPGIDPRLVGEWINVDPTKFSGWRQFDDDGIHRYAAFPTNTIPNTLPGISSWSVSGQTLTFTQRPAWIMPGRSLRGWIFDIINRIRLGSGTEYYDILEVTPDTLRIQSRSGAPIEEYRRKP